MANALPDGSGVAIEQLHNLFANTFRILRAACQLHYGRAICVGVRL